MINFINDIAKINKNERFDAIVKVLNDNNLQYTVEKIPGHNTTGNIIIELNPSDSKKIVVIAHYDNAFNTPGANDNASACSILLNLLLELKDTDKHIEFVFFDLEEKGLRGSEYYAKNNIFKISCAINLDMCGMGENIVFCKRRIDNKNVLDVFNKHNCIEVYGLPLGDAYSFINYGFPTIYVINSTTNDVEWFKEFSKGHKLPEQVDFLKTMHQPNDTVDTINLEQVEKIQNFVKDIIIEL